MFTPLSAVLLLCLAVACNATWIKQDYDVATLYSSTDCTGVGSTMKRSDPHQNKQGCYSVAPHKRSIILHVNGQIYYDNNCNTHGNGKPTVNKCAAITGNSDIRGFHID